MIKNTVEANAIRKTYESKLRKLRKSCDLSLNDVSRETGISKQTLHSWENGTIKNVGPKYQPNLNKLARLYGVNKTEINSLVRDAWLGFKKQTAKYNDNLNNKTLIYRLRVENGKTLQNLADLLGTNIYNIVRFEDGLKVPTDKQLNKLAKYFNVSASNIKNDILSKKDKE